jgi:3-oxoacyl-[acyl-carrier protein] reductase
MTTRTALVTGASRGIGRATSLRLLQDDAEVDTLVVLARPSQEFNLTLAELRAHARGRRIVEVALDIGDRDALLGAIAQLHDAIGNVDILVNNAGYTNPIPIHQVEFADFERTMAVNVYAPFSIVQELLHRGNRFEVIVNIASTAGINGRAGWLTYSASKAALINMSEVMREELRVDDTRVVCLSPGRTATDLRRVLAPTEDPTTIMQPEQVADVIAVMLGPSGRFVDQQNVIVRR